MIRRTILLCCLALAFSGCRGGGKTELQEMGTYHADPQNVSRDRPLYNTVPVVALKFEATEAGYTMKAFPAVGVPTSPIDQNRDVIVKASDSAGRVVSTVSVFNPRDVHTVGTKQPGQAVRSKASFTIFFPKPDDVTTVEVTVLRGANSGLRQTFNLTPRDLPLLEQ